MTRDDQLRGVAALAAHKAAVEGTLERVLSLTFALGAAKRALLDLKRCVPEAVTIERYEGSERLRLNGPAFIDHQVNKIDALLAPLQESTDG